MDVDQDGGPVRPQRQRALASMTMKAPAVAPPKPKPSPVPAAKVSLPKPRPVVSTPKFGGGGPVARLPASSALAASVVALANPKAARPKHWPVESVDDGVGASAAAAIAAVRRAEPAASAAAAVAAVAQRAEASPPKARPPPASSGGSIAASAGPAPPQAKTLLGTAAPAPKACGAIRSWEVVGEPAVNVRNAMHPTAEKITIKYRQSIVRGQQVGDWVKLVGEDGYMLISHPAMGALLRDAGPDISEDLDAGNAQKKGYSKAAPGAAASKEARALVPASAPAAASVPGPAKAPARPPPPPPPRVPKPAAVVHPSPQAAAFGAPVPIASAAPPAVEVDATQSAGLPPRLKGFLSGEPGSSSTSGTLQMPALRPLPGILAAATTPAPPAAAGSLSLPSLDFFMVQGTDTPVVDVQPVIITPPWHRAAQSMQNTNAAIAAADAAVNAVARRAEAARDAASDVGLPMGATYATAPRAAMGPTARRMVGDSKPAPRAAPDRDAGFQIGERVAYWSKSHERWVISRVESVQFDEEGRVTSYDLTTKPDAKPELVRAATAAEKGHAAATAAQAEGSTGQQQLPAREASHRKARQARGESKEEQPLSKNYRVGSKVFYWSTKKSKWLQAVVTALTNVEGVAIFDLQITAKKPGSPGLQICGATVERLRPRKGNKEKKLKEEKKTQAAPGGQPAAKRRRRLEDIAAVGEEDAWDALDAALPATTRESAHRWKSLQMQAKQQLGGAFARRQKKEKRGLLPAAKRSCAIGDNAFVWTGLQGKWGEGKVLAVHTDELGVVQAYDIELRAGLARKNIPAAEVRPRKEPPPAVAPPAKEAQVFSAGDKVRYWSISHAKWVPAKVTGVYYAWEGGPVLSYDLNLKSKAETYNVRPPSTPPDAPAPVASTAFRGAAASKKRQRSSDPSTAAAAAAGTGGEDLQVGEKVEYFSKKDSQWLPGIVKARNIGDGGKVRYTVLCETIQVTGASAKSLRRPLPPPRSAQ
eukprot:TRINITY_DN32868_c0_g1_i1.p1 TRINITY_DN32868_c0_g1~~TRINITY_DN32868_c0_g1_i1.p1  ORF type:complete len:989 (+),score=244.28 TRINITY_DN32868_c0_g1_i1:187-3153(+)